MQGLAKELVCLPTNLCYVRVNLRRVISLVTSLTTSHPGIGIVSMCLSECTSCRITGPLRHIEPTSFSSGPHNQNMGYLGKESQAWNISVSFLCDYLGLHVFFHPASDGQL
jgi:hypothetical protein